MFIHFKRFPSCNSQLVSWKFNFEDPQNPDRPHLLTWGPQGGTGGPQFQKPVGSVNSVLRKSPRLERKEGPKALERGPGRGFRGIRLGRRWAERRPPRRGGSGGGSFGVAPGFCSGGPWPLCAVGTRRQPGGGWLGGEDFNWPQWDFSASPSPVVWTAGKQIQRPTLSVEPPPPPVLENCPDLRTTVIIDTELKKLYNTLGFGDLDGSKWVTVYKQKV